MSEEESKPQPQQPHKKLTTRRQFLKLAGIGVGAALADNAVRKILVNQNLITTIPDAPLVSVSLKQTATVLELTHQQSSFREEAGYTKEMFEAVRRGTFIIQITCEDEKERYQLYASTGWLAQQSEHEHTYYVVTNRHVVNRIIEPPKGIKPIGLKLWRPDLDDEIFEPSWVTVATSDTSDLAVLKLQGYYFPKNPVETLKWEDHVSLKKGDKALIVGFPGEFRNDQTGATMDSFTLGSVITIAENTDSKGKWHAKALVNYGNSGSPIVVNRNGKAVAVGIAYSGGTRIFENDVNQTQRQPAVGGYSLSVGDLITAVDKKDI